MNWREKAAQRAETLMHRWGMSYEHLLGFRFAINVFIATAIVWSSLELLADTNPIWAIASMVAAADPQPEEARRLFKSRMINVVVGCVVGSALLLIGRHSQWMIPLAMSVTVLISSYLVRVKTMWRQAPVTAAVVIAAGLAQSSSLKGFEKGMHKVGEVLFGCIVGILVSLAMSRLWLIKPPKPEAKQAPQS
jgi:uncharacterized membrane protein YccC